jgi:hypothetical protein
MLAARRQKEIYMKLKSGFVLEEIAGECVVLAADSALNLDGMITLNSTAKTMWLLVSEGATMDGLIDALIAEYGISRELASDAAESFVKRLQELDFLA